MKSRFLMEKNKVRDHLWGIDWLRMGLPLKARLFTRIRLISIIIYEGESREREKVWHRKVTAIGRMRQLMQTQLI